MQLVLAGLSLQAASSMRGGLRLPAQLFSSGVAAGWQRWTLCVSNRACWCLTGPVLLAGAGSRWQCVWRVQSAALLVCMRCAAVVYLCGVCSTWPRTPVSYAFLLQAEVVVVFLEGHVAVLHYMSINADISSQRAGATLIGAALCRGSLHVGPVDH